MFCYVMRCSITLNNAMLGSPVMLSNVLSGSRVTLSNAMLGASKLF